MALRYTLNFKDTLRAFRIYFDPASFLSTSESLSKFRIYIWANNGSAPGSEIYHDSVMYPKYYDTLFKLTPQYTLTTPLLLEAGTYFFGIQQEVASGIVIGFDRNQDFHQNLYYNLGNTWQPSSIKGSLMLRPVLGSFIPSPASLKKSTLDNNLSINIFPNPVNSDLNLTFKKKNQREVQIFNTLGQEVYHYIGEESSIRFNTSELKSGIYFLRVDEGAKQIINKKFIVQH